MMKNKWQQFEANTSVSLLEDQRQDVTMVCPSCRKLYISNMDPGCDLCGFKWGD